MWIISRENPFSQNMIFLKNKIWFFNISTKSGELEFSGLKQTNRWSFSHELIEKNHLLHNNGCISAEAKQNWHFSMTKRPSLKNQFDAQFSSAILHNEIPDILKVVQEPFSQWCEAYIY